MKKSNDNRSARASLLKIVRYRINGRYINSMKRNKRGIICITREICEVT